MLEKNILFLFITIEEQNEMQVNTLAKLAKN